jgi:hypothetical protein
MQQRGDPHHRQRADAARSKVKQSPRLRRTGSDDFSRVVPTEGAKAG